MGDTELGVAPPYRLCTLYYLPFIYYIFENGIEVLFLNLAVNIVSVYLALKNSVT